MWPTIRNQLADLRHRRYFHRLLLQRWNVPQRYPTKDGVEALGERISARSSKKVLKKGEPDVAAYTRRTLAPLSSALGANDRLAALRHCRAAANVTPSDDELFELYRLSFLYAYENQLKTLASAVSPFVALHITCAPRTQRAVASAESLRVCDGEITSLIIEGSGFGGALKLARLGSHILLSVPVDDSYEHLPSKVVWSLSMLAYLKNVRAAIKLDDDHRLKDGGMLVRALHNQAADPRPIQTGNIYSTRFYGDQNRIWHVGKCRDPLVNHSPFDGFGALRWATGQAGYFMNRPALLRMHWADLYYSGEIHRSLFEDAFVSQALVRLGGRLRAATMESFLSTVEQY